MEILKPALAIKTVASKINSLASDCTEEADRLKETFSKSHFSNGEATQI